MPHAGGFPLHLLGRPSRVQTRIPIVMRSKRTVAILAILLIGTFVTWRFVRPMNIFVVTKNFERPIPTTIVPEILDTLSADECADCHQAFFDEWNTTIHSQAWTEPYFQKDFAFDGSQQICKNCHTPLDRQQESLVLGFRDSEKWDPILTHNPDFDPDLQNEGVTCAACHLREGKILGVFGSEEAPHAVRKISDGNQICVSCHVVDGQRWDTFFKFPPCGTVAEIADSADHKAAGDNSPYTVGSSGEIVMADTASLGCVDCHMPLVERPLVEGGKARMTRQHLWRGGHDPEMVKSGLAFDLTDETVPGSANHSFAFTITNVGAAHYLPTGTPDRHLTVQMRVLTREGALLSEINKSIKRTIMWRPFIMDLWDTRLKRDEPRTYRLEFLARGDPAPHRLEIVVRYYLVDDKRRARIGYEDAEASSYEVFRQIELLDDGVGD